MSNLIKYSFVDLQNKDAYVIDYEKGEREHFTPLHENSRKKVENVEHPDDFEPGVPVRNFDEMFKEQEEEAKARANQIIEDAKKQAEEILLEAQQQAERVKEQAQEEGTRQGMETGLAQAEEELAARRQELEQQQMEKEREYQQLLEEIEPKYAEVLCSLLQKLTGILITNKRDVLLHLIRASVKDINPAKQYMIHASAEDVTFLESHRGEILLQTGEGTNVEIQEEKGLAKGECIVETDTQMIDCGFRTQLDNLMTTLRMLAAKD